MHKILTIATMLVAFFCSFTSVAQEESVEEASLLIRSGNLSEAHAMLQKLESKTPKNGQINILLGQVAEIEGNSQLAIEEYKKAQKKGVNDAWLSLASLATKEYRIETAEEDIELYRKGLKKGRKTLPDESEDVVQQLSRTKNMLDRVEKIVIIDSLNVDAEDFFRHYRLSPEAGTLSSTDEITDVDEIAQPSVVYTTNSDMLRYFAVVDTAQMFEIAASDKLYGGEWAPPVPVGDILNEGGDANYPFLMPDGITLYYANDGENSLGGYDIFVSRKSGTDFLAPQNIGMPYNSPYNDYMLAIDEMTGVGWWATDRNRIPGMVTIYVFIPSEMRVNYEVDNPNLASFAKINSYRDTWEEGKDYSDILGKIAAINPDSKKEKKESFRLNIPGKGVITSMNQLHTPDSKRIMKEYLKALEKLDKSITGLDSLRARYAAGEHTLGQQILELEKSIPSQRLSLKNMRNKIIKLENR